MRGPLHIPTVLLCYPFHFREPVTHNWVRARYVAERHQIAARYREWEIAGPPEMRLHVRLTRGARTPSFGPSDRRPTHWNAEARTIPRPSKRDPAHSTLA